MKIKEQFMIKTIGTDKVLVSSEPSGLNYARIMVLNEAAEFLLRETGHQSFTSTQWAELLVDRYGIDPEQALQDAERLISKLIKEKGLE